MSEQINAVAVFNQYYLDLLKQLKKATKTKRDKDVDARKILRSIRTHYETFDKASLEHRESYKTNFSEMYVELMNITEDDAWKEYVKNTSNDELCMFKDITFGQVKKFVPMMFVYQYLDMLYLFINDSEIERINILISVISCIGKMNTEEECTSYIVDNKTPIDCIETIKRMWRLSQRPTKMDLNDLGLGDIENTSIGKLAKEIVQEIDLNDIKAQMGNLSGGDVFSALTQENGLGKIVASVGNKIQSKLMNGELSQELLLQDALSLAAKLPSMMGAGGGGMGGMMGGLSGMGDLSGMMSMIQQMASGFNTGAPSSTGRPSSARRHHRMRTKQDKKKPTI